MGGVFSIIPRLVVHKDEIHCIYFPDEHVGEVSRRAHHADGPPLQNDTGGCILVDCSVLSLSPPDNGPFDEEDGMSCHRGGHHGTAEWATTERNTRRLEDFVSILSKELPAAVQQAAAKVPRGGIFSLLKGRGSTEGSLGNAGRAFTILRIADATSEKPTSSRQHIAGDVKIQMTLTPESCDGDPDNQKPQRRRHSLTALQDVPVRVIQISSEVAERVLHVPDRVKQVSAEIAQDLVQIPHTASHHWNELTCVLLVMTLLTLLVVGAMLFAPSIPSANDGLRGGNRTFLYGFLTYYELLVAISLVETCNFAVPGVWSLPVRLFCVIVLLVIQKLVDAAIAEGWLHPASIPDVFPIPFSLVLSSLLCFLLIVPVLRCMHNLAGPFGRGDVGSTHNGDRQSATRRTSGVRIFADVPFCGLFRLFYIYMISMLLVGLWAVCVCRLKSYNQKVYQNLVGSLFGPLRFFCKILCAAPLTTKLNPRRWILLNLVVDIWFTRVQMSTIPYLLDHYVPFLSVLATEVATLLWRYYSGIDRLALFWNTCARQNIAEGSEASPASIGTQYAEDPSCSDGRHGTYQGHSSDEVLTTSFADRLNRRRMMWHRPSSNSSSDAEPDGGATGEFRASRRDLTAGCFVAPISHIAQIQLDIRQQEANSTKSDSRRSLVVPPPEEDYPPAAESPQPGQNTAISPSDGGENRDCDDEASVGTISTSAGLSEEHWEQRPLYHILDAVGSLVISIMVRINQQLTLILSRNLPISKYLVAPIQEIDADGWGRSVAYSWALIALLMILLASLDRLFLSRLLQPRREAGSEAAAARSACKPPLTLSRVVSYVFTKDHFWFLFWWLCATGGHVLATLFPHFGNDGSLEFQWVGCDPDHVSWPRCE